MSSLPLEGIRVLDLSHVWAGPTTARILSDLGADVIKIERAAQPDNTRNLYVADWDHRADFWNRGLYFQKAQAGKRAITLDLSTEAGAGIFRRLVALADVILENFTPRVMKSLGFDYESVKKIKPDIIMISITGYGQTGPRANYTALGMGLEPAVGVPSVTGYPDGPPYKNGNTYVDPFGGILGAGAVLAALHYRRRTGKGQYIDLSLQEATIPVMGEALMEYQLNQRLLPRTGNRGRFSAPQGMYRCRGADDWLYISIQSEAEWKTFCETIGHQEWLEDERFAGLLSRRRHHDELDALITEWSQSQDKIEAMHLLQRAGILAAAVLNPKETLLDPHLKARGFFTPIAIPGAGVKPVQRYVPAKFSRFDPKARGPAPSLGQHNREILQGMLGLSDEEIVKLEQEQVIGSEPVLALPRDEFVKNLVQPLERYLEQGSLLAIDPDYKEVIARVVDNE